MAASGFSFWAHMPEGGSGEYLEPGHQSLAVASSEVAGTSRDAPPVYPSAMMQTSWGEVGVTQVNGSSLPWSDLTSTQHTGALHEDDEHRTPSSELNFGMYEVTPDRHEHQQHQQDDAENFGVAGDQQREILVFPEGEDDAVTITGSDLEGLQPMRFLSDNIIDFYIKFLERRLSSEDRVRCYFFNSFFCTKLLGDSRSSAELHECGVDFDQVRSWTGGVNLFEKDYVFIPILRSSHWSLIIVCHLNSLTTSRDKRKGSLCVYHLDPFEGRHGRFEDQIRRYGDSNDKDRMVLALACEMKYVQAQVPQQGNGYDSGVYLLHYVESFLRSSKKWRSEETSHLLEHMVEVGRIRIRKGTKSATHWDVISKDMKTKLGSMRTEDECRRRYDTLLKAYKKVKKTGKSFWDLTSKERGEVNLATPLTDEWYRAIDTICLRRDSGNAKSRKRVKRNANGQADMPSGNPAPPPLQAGCPEPEVPSQKQIAIPRFSALPEDLRSTLLNLIQIKSKGVYGRHIGNGELEAVCRMLAILEDRKPWEIRRNIYELLEHKLVDFERFGILRNKFKYLDLDNLWVFKKFVEKVLHKNPNLNIFLKLWRNHDVVSFPKAAASLFLQRIRVLSLCDCFKLTKVDLSCFPELRSLEIHDCTKLKLVTGWEVVTKLGWLEILACKSYVDFPPVQKLPSLRELSVFTEYALDSQMMNSVLHFRPCVQLRRLEITHIKSSAVNNMDVSMLRFLEVLTLSGCDALTTIQGLSGLHSLTRLNLQDCGALRRVPELGCLKALTHLDMIGSGVEVIPGVQELYLLTSLELCGCGSLEVLPFLGRLRALAFLDISETGVDEIPGVQYLVSLETLDCGCSKVKWLPDLHHLPQLEWVDVSETPLSEMDSSSIYFGKDVVDFKSSNEERKVCLAEISDMSDTE